MITDEFFFAFTKTMMQAEALDEAHEFSNSLLEKKVKSKRWLTEEVLKHVQPKNTLLLGAWYATLIPYEIGGHFDCIDLDPRPKRLSKKFVKKVDNKYTMRYNTCDAFDYCAIKDISTYDLVINTSCEHMPNMSEIVKPNTIFAFQSNNYFEIEEHVNCKSSLDEFIYSTGLTTILYSGELETEKYTRYMVIGKCD